MKKFFIVLCGILIMENAVAKRSPKNPTAVQSYIQDAWSADTTNDNKYSKDVWSANANPRLALYGQFNTRAGTWGANNEGSIVAIMATEIWENGGNFCTRQIQLAWSGGNSNWMSYHTKNGYKCAKICKPGWSGNKCETHQFDCDDMNVNYLTNLNDVTDWNLQILTGKDEGDVTNNTEVFSQHNASDSAKAYILGLLERRQHSVLVAPVRVSGNKSKGIREAYSTQELTVLCAPGYIASDSIYKDCVIAPQCGGSEKSMCPGETNEGFDETQHMWEIGDDCKRYRCQNNKGFRSTNDKTCIECSGAPLAYVNEYGVCAICNKGEYPEDGHCTTDKMTKYSQDRIKSNGGRECWLETDQFKFAGCVYGCTGNTECYVGKRCVKCD